MRAHQLTNEVGKRATERRMVNVDAHMQRIRDMLDWSPQEWHDAVYPKKQSDDNYDEFDDDLEEVGQASNERYITQDELKQYGKAADLERLRELAGTVKGNTDE